METAEHFKPSVRKMSYGFSLIGKEGCINHIAKRTGSAICGLAKTYKSQRLMREKGCLTQVIIKRITSDYSWVLKNSSTSVEDMQRVVMARFKHMTSTDANPDHKLYPLVKTPGVCTAVLRPRVMSYLNTSSTSFHMWPQRCCQPFKGCQMSEPGLLKRCQVQ